LKYGFSKTARIASALTVALTVIVVVALLEGGRSEVHTAGHASTQPQSDADSNNGQLSNPLPVKVTAHSAAAPTESAFHWRLDYAGRAN
jgi:hypothetical protein